MPISRRAFLTASTLALAPAAVSAKNNEGFMTTYKTGNPLGSNAVKDLYDNAENFDRALNGMATTWDDRQGNTRVSWSSIENSINAVESDANRQIANTTNNANAIIAGLGYQVPVQYAPGIELTLQNQTIEYDGNTYAPIASELPFVTSGAFESDKFRLIQGVASVDMPYFLEPKFDKVSEFGRKDKGILYRSGTIYELKGTVTKTENRALFHDFRPTIADGSEFNTDGANTFFGLGSGNFTMKAIPDSELPPGFDPNLQCSHNTGFGLNTLHRLTIGYKNVAVGNNAGRYLTDGNGNVFVGQEASRESRNQSRGVSIGFAAGMFLEGTYNTAIGASALYYNTEGSGNIAIGRRASFDSQEGGFNISIGNDAGLGRVSGSENIIIGRSYLPPGYSSIDYSLIIGGRITGLQDERGQVVLANGLGEKFLEIHKDAAPTVKKPSYLELASREATGYDPNATDGQVQAGSSLILRSLVNTGDFVSQIAFFSRVNENPGRIVYTGTGAGASFRFVVGGSEAIKIDGSHSLLPSKDNTQNLGSGSLRYANIYAGTGTISTSDANDKTPPLPIDDEVLDAWSDVNLIAYRWLEAIHEKGDTDARWHFGVIAQQIRDAFANRGIDGTRYGFLCRDVWDDEYQTIPAEYVDHDAVYKMIDSDDGSEEIARDEDGNLIVITPAWREKISDEKTVLIRSAGERWGVRADQCLWLEAAYQRRRIGQLEARLAALERSLS